MPTCSNGHHVTKAWVRVNGVNGEVKYCPRCPEIRKIGDSSNAAKEGNHKAESRPAGEKWYNE